MLVCEHISVPLLTMWSHNLLLYVVCIALQNFALCPNSFDGNWGFIVSYTWEPVPQLVRCSASENWGQAQQSLDPAHWPLWFMTCYKLGLVLVYKQVGIDDGIGVSIWNIGFCLMQLSAWEYFIEMSLILICTCLCKCTFMSYFDTSTVRSLWITIWPKSAQLYQTHQLWMACSYIMISNFCRVLSAVLCLLGNLLASELLVLMFRNLLAVPSS